MSMRIKVTKDQAYTEKLEIPTRGIVSVDVFHVERFMLCESSYHALYRHYLRDRFWPGLWAGRWGGVRGGGGGGSGS